MLVHVHPFGWFTVQITYFGDASPKEHIVDSGKLEHEYPHALKVKYKGS